MKKFFMAMCSGTALVLLTLAPIVHGQGLMIQEEAISPNVKYMSGGVGVEERTAMESQAKGYDLKLTFAITPGNYVSLVDVKINDQAGKPMISAQSNGPWFYADLPKGSYTVVADYEGQQKSQKVTVNGGLKNVVFHWKPDQSDQAASKGETRAGAADRKRKPSEKAVKGGAAEPRQPGRMEQAK